MNKKDKTAIIEKLKAINKITVPQMSDPIGLRIHTIQLNSYKDAKNTFYFKSHKHSFFEVFFVINGNVAYEISNQKAPALASEGEFILVPPDVEHSLLECSSEFVRLSFCFEFEDFDKNELTAYMREALLSLKSQSRKMDDETELGVYAIAEHASAKSCFSPYLLRNDVFGLIFKLSKIALPNQEPTLDSQSEDALADSRCVYAKKFIKDNIYSNIKTTEVAANVHLSAKQLNRLFLKYEGKSVFDYIREKRCSAAKKLLLNKNLSISEISEMLGFSDEFYFNRFFKVNTGFPPNKFRLLNGGK